MPIIKENAKVYSFDAVASNSMKSKNPYSGCREVDTAKCLDTTVPTHAKNQGGIAIVQPTTYCLQGNGIDRADTAGCNGRGWRKDVGYTLNTIDRPAVSVSDARGNGNGMVSPTLTGDHQDRITDYTAICHDNRGGGEKQNMEEWREHCRVRRLTPLECTRLQGLPDGWVDIPPLSDNEVTAELIAFFRNVWRVWDACEKGCDENDVKPRSNRQIKKWLQSETVDAPKYKALGNGIATPSWKYIIKRISAQYERDATMGSLFDGIGSFPYLWEQINGQGSCKWASEIEPYPIKVSVYRLGLEIEKDNTNED